MRGSVCIGFGAALLAGAFAGGPNGIGVFFVFSAGFSALFSVILRRWVPCVPSTYRSR